MKVRKKEFIEQLESVSPGLARQEMLEQSDCFVFQDGKVFTYNEEVACVAPVGLGIAGAVPAEPLLKILKKIPGKEVEIEQTDEGLVIRRLEKEAKVKRKAVVQFMSKVELPVSEVEAPGKWRILSSGFDDAISFTASCASDDQTKFFLTCIHIGPEWIEASDDYRVCRYRIKTRVDEDVLIRATCAKMLSRFEFSKISTTEDWVHFQAKSGCTISCRRYMGKYPDVGKHLEVNGSQMELPDGMKEAVEKCCVFSNEDLQRDEVIVELKKGGLRITGKGPMGYYEETRAVSYDGDRVGFRINPELLQDVVMRTNECIIAPGRIQVKTDEWVYVTCTAEMED